jgi:hypothetical protein
MVQAKKALPSGQKGHIPSKPEGVPSSLAAAIRRVPGRWWTTANPQPNAHLEPPVVSTSMTEPHEDSTVTTEPPMLSPFHATTQADCPQQRTISRRDELPYSAPTPLYETRESNQFPVNSNASGDQACPFCPLPQEAWGPGQGLADP